MSGARPRSSHGRPCSGGAAWRRPRVARRAPPLGVHDVVGQREGEALGRARLVPLLPERGRGGACPAAGHTGWAGWSGPPLTCRRRCTHGSWNRPCSGRAPRLASAAAGAGAGVLAAAWRSEAPAPRAAPPSAAARGVALPALRARAGVAVARAGRPCIVTAWPAMCWVLRAREQSGRALAFGALGGGSLSLETTLAPDDSASLPALSAAKSLSPDSPSSSSDASTRPRGRPRPRPARAGCLPAPGAPARCWPGSASGVSRGPTALRPAAAAGAAALGEGGWAAGTGAASGVHVAGDGALHAGALSVRARLAEGSSSAACVPSVSAHQCSLWARPGHGRPGGGTLQRALPVNDGHECEAD